MRLVEGHRGQVTVDRDWKRCRNLPHDAKWQSLAQSISPRNARRKRLATCKDGIWLLRGNQPGRTTCLFRRKVASGITRGHSYKLWSEAVAALKVVAAHGQANRWETLRRIAPDDTVERMICALPGSSVERERVRTDRLRSGAALGWCFGLRSSSGSWQIG